MILFYLHPASVKCLFRHYGIPSLLHVKVRAIVSLFFFYRFTMYLKGTQVYEKGNGFSSCDRDLG